MTETPSDVVTRTISSAEIHTARDDSSSAAPTSSSTISMCGPKPRNSRKVVAQQLATTRSWACLRSSGRAGFARPKVRVRLPHAMTGPRLTSLTSRGRRIARIARRCRRAGDWRQQAGFVAPAEPWKSPGSGRCLSCPRPLCAGNGNQSRRCARRRTPRSDLIAGVHERAEMVSLV